jgi:hypothetical protein
MEGMMDSFQAFINGEAARASGAKTMVFDWIKAAEIIRDRRPSSASAGLRGDWEWTGGSIFADGKPIPRGETYTYLASIWARPELDIDGDVIECWRWQHDTQDDWDASTYWPDEALQVLNANQSA